MLKNQLFGVEVEMTGITREKAARIIADVLGTTPSRPESSCYHARAQSLIRRLANGKL